jgi:hypothetical protein
MKRSSSTISGDARHSAKKPCQPKIPTTGIFAPEQLANIADSIKTSRTEFEAKRPHVCPVPKCKERYCYRSGLEAHMKSKHPGYPLPLSLQQLQSQLRELRQVEQECFSAVAACAEISDETDAAAALDTLV